MAVLEMSSGVSQNYLSMRLDILSDSYIAREVAATEEVRGKRGGGGPETSTKDKV